jgi:hypothetical protein
MREPRLLPATAPVFSGPGLLPPPLGYQRPRLAPATAGISAAPACSRHRWVPVGPTCPRQGSGLAGLDHILVALKPTINTSHWRTKSPSAPQSLTHRPSHN